MGFFKQWRSVCGVVLAVAVLAVTPDAVAQLYSCKGDDGKTRYVSDAEECGGNRAVLRGQKKSKTKTKSKAKTSGKSPGRLPRVSSKKQSALDKKRTQVLMYELRSELEVYAQLEDAIVEISPNDSSLADNLQQERDEHGRNIVAIRQELARLGVYAGHSGN